MTKEPHQERAKRSVVNLKVNLKLPDQDAFVERFAQNISRSGIFVRAKKPPEPGTRVKFEYRLADETRVLRGFGVVRWARTLEEDATKPPGMGVEFVDVDSQTEELINRIVATHGEGEFAPKKRKAPHKAAKPPAGAAKPVAPDVDATLVDDLLAADESTGELDESVDVQASDSDAPATDTMLDTLGADPEDVDPEDDNVDVEEDALDEADEDDEIAAQATESIEDGPTDDPRGLVVDLAATWPQISPPSNTNAEPIFPETNIPHGLFFAALPWRSATQLGLAHALGIQLAEFEGTLVAADGEEIDLNDAMMTLLGDIDAEHGAIERIVIPTALAGLAEPKLEEVIAFSGLEPPKVLTTRQLLGAAGLRENTLLVEVGRYFCTLSWRDHGGKDSHQVLAGCGSEPFLRAVALAVCGPQESETSDEERDELETDLIDALIALGHDGDEELTLTIDDEDIAFTAQDIAPTVMPIEAAIVAAIAQCADSDRCSLQDGITLLGDPILWPGLAQRLERSLGIKITIVDDHVRFSIPN